MSPLHIVLRLVHIGGGVFWIGTLMFNSIFLGPAVREAGPEGGKVMGILMRRGMAKIMPMVALATIIAGIWMYYRDSGGFSRAYMSTHTGMAFGTGGIFAIITLAIGGALLAPVLTRMGEIGQAMQQASPAEREKLAAELNGLRGKAKTTGNIATTFGVIATLIMAIARYI